MLANAVKFGYDSTCSYPYKTGPPASPTKTALSGAVAEACRAFPVGLMVAYGEGWYPKGSKSPSSGNML